jgi:hypothetical protein
LAGRSPADSSLSGESVHLETRWQQDADHPDIFAREFLEAIERHWQRSNVWFWHVQP